MVLPVRQGLCPPPGRAAALLRDPRARGAVRCGAAQSAGALGLLLWRGVFELHYEV